MKIEELIKNLKAVSKKLAAEELVYNRDRAILLRNKFAKLDGKKCDLSAEELAQLELKQFKQKGIIRALYGQKALLENPLIEHKVLASDMVDQLELSTGKKWKVVSYASKSGMKTGADELPPFFDLYCEPSGGIIFASDDSELYGKNFVMLEDSEPMLSPRENIVLKCGVYHIRYSKMDRDIETTIINDTACVDLLRRKNSVVGAYICSEKTTEIDVFDGNIDSRILKYVERSLQERFKDVDITIPMGSTNRKR